MREIKLGDKVKDKITGLVGITIAKCTYIHGCTQFQVQPKAKANILTKAHWIDEPQLESLEPELPKVNIRTNWQPSGGGMRDHPPEED